MQSPLPFRLGVPPSRLHLPKAVDAGAWRYVVDYLEWNFQYLPSGVIRQRVAQGDFKYSDGRTLSLNSPFEPDIWLWYYREVEPEVELDYPKIIYSDQYLVVIDKPHGMASLPCGRHLHQTALIKVRRMLGNDELNVVHRLDRETAGLLVFCTQAKWRGKYQTLFQERKIRKVYEAIAPAPNYNHTQGLVFPLQRSSFIVPSPNPFIMVENLKLAPNSTTNIDLIKTHGDFAHYKIEPLTGRKHQIRVHMNGLGLPIVGDAVYPFWLPEASEQGLTKTLQLLASQLEFIDPITGEARCFKSELSLSF